MSESNLASADYSTGHQATHPDLAAYPTQLKSTLEHGSANMIKERRLQPTRLYGQSRAIRAVEQAQANAFWLFPQWRSCSSCARGDESQRIVIPRTCGRQEWVFLRICSTWFNLCDPEERTRLLYASGLPAGTGRTSLGRFIWNYLEV